MDGAGDHLLAGAALALNQHGGIGRGDHVDHLAQLAHGGAIADQRAGAQRMQLAAVEVAGVGERGVVEGAADGEFEFVEVDRLGQVVGGAAAYHRDGVADRAEAGQHDHRVLAGEFGQHVAAFGVGQLVVEYDEVGFHPLQQCPGLRPVCRRMGVVAETRATARYQAAEHRVVVDHEYGFLHRSLLPCSRGRVMVKVVPAPGVDSTAMVPP